MRVFIGIRPDGEALTRLERETAPLRREFPDFKWVDPGNRHLTLRFLGELRPADADKLCRRLKSTPPAPDPIPLEINRLGGFPDDSAPRVIWAGIQDSPLLNNLFNRLEEILESLGIPRETRMFHPHITLARTRRGQPAPRRLAERLRAAPRRIAAFRVKAVTVFQSVLFPEGPRYSILEEISLDPT